MGRMRFIRRFAGGINGDFVFALDGRTAADPTPWRIYVRGQPLPLAGTTIVLDQPVDNQIVGGKLAVMGWAFAQDGVDRVNLRFHDARVVVAATLFDRPDVRAIFPAARGFVVLLPKRPPAIPPNTDIQVEIIDGRGVRSRLGSRQFTWF